MTNSALREEWNDLSDLERVEAFESLPRDRADGFFLQLSSRDQVNLLLALPEGERRIWLRLLPPDWSATLCGANSSPSPSRRIKRP
jgi:magnesium transporter